MVTLKFGIQDIVDTRIDITGSKGRSIEGLCWSYNEQDPLEPPRLFSIGGSTYITEWDLSTGRPLINYDCNAGIICVSILIHKMID